MDTSVVLLFFVALVASDFIVLGVQPGANVTLRCRVDHNVSIRAVKWTRADLKTPEYVLYYRDGRSDPTNQHPSFKDRVELVDSELKDGDASLFLRNARVSDSGVYGCQVTDRSKIRDKKVKRIKLEVTDSGSKRKKPTDGNNSRSWKIVLKVVCSAVFGLGAGAVWICKRCLKNQSEEPTAAVAVGDQVL